MELTQGLHRSLQCHPDRPTVLFPGGHWTTTEFVDRIARLAGGLHSLGLKAGDRVGMLGVNSPQFLVYDLAVLWAGGVVNPVNIRWSHAEILYSLDESGTTILLVDETFRAAGEALARDARTLEHVIYVGDGPLPPGMIDYEALLRDSSPVPDAQRGGDDLAGLFYTGGTTGFPKGVMLSHGNLVTSTFAGLAAGRLGVNATFLHTMPMFHLANYAAVCGVVTSGATHAVEGAFAPESALRALAKYRVTDVTLAPTMLQMVLAWMDEHPAEAAALDLSAIRLITYGASPISQTTLRRAQAVFPDAGFSQSYGMTELSPLATILAPEDHTEEAFASGRMKSAGRAALCAQVRMVDAEDREVPRGTVGEIIVRGAHVMKGYWNQPEATAHALRGGWMHTGDGGYMDAQGYVYVVDRMKDMIVTGGENVYSAEVENALASHPAIAQCGVIGIPSEQWGEAVHAVVVLKPGASATAAEIQAHCRERIAAYKCPKSVEFRDALPLSSIGKVLKTELRKPWWEGRERTVS